jgi:predicted RND superfamily exporter protein
MNVDFVKARIELLSIFIEFNKMFLETDKGITNLQKDLIKKATSKNLKVSIPNSTDIVEESITTFKKPLDESYKLIIEDLTRLENQFPKDPVIESCKKTIEEYYKQQQEMYKILEEKSIEAMEEYFKPQTEILKKLLDTLEEMTKNTPDVKL